MFVPISTFHGSGMSPTSDPAASDTAERHLDLIVKISTDQDKDAFDELFQWFGPWVKAMMLKLGANNDLAEDLMQDTMMTVWMKAGQFASWKGSAGAWIFTIARNKRIDRFRRQSTRHYVDVDGMEFADDAPDGEDMVLADERDRIVSNATAGLPEELREIVRLAFVEEKSQTEIASELGIPLGTVKSRTRRAYQKIRDELEDVL